MRTAVDTPDLHVAKADTIPVIAANTLIDITAEEYNQAAPMPAIIDSSNIQEVENADRSVISLKLDNGGKIIFTDSLNTKYDEDRKEYSYLGFIKRLNRHVVLAEYWEEHDYLLINPSSGSTDTLMSEPIISPDDKHLVNVSPPWGLEGAPNGIQIFAIDKVKGFTLVKEFMQEEWAPREMIWKDAGCLYLKITPVEKYFVNNEPGNYFEYKKFIIAPSPK